jgi:MFS family permease
LGSPIFYGYYLVGVAFAAQFISTGMYSYVLGSFMDPMISELNWSRADFTLTRTIGQMVMALVGIYIGSRVDVYGGRPIMLCGSLLLGATLALTSLVDSLWMWLLLNGVMVTIGCAMLGNLVVNVTLSKWFVERRGIVIAIAAMGVSFGGVVLTPLGNLAGRQFGLARCLDLAWYLCHQSDLATGAGDASRPRRPRSAPGRILCGANCCGAGRACAPRIRLLVLTL